ncbi:helix-turn-helix domain protein [Peptococcaceae bacterium CEB3]|nr:helix-turn-helix domain protein [Peptococcaceae bacterium CEB3]
MRRRLDLTQHSTHSVFEKGQKTLMEKTKIEKRTLTIAEAAEFIGISRSLAFRLVREGKLPTIQLYTKRLIPISVLEKWLEEQIRTPKHA